MNIEITVFWDAKQCYLVDGTKVLQDPAAPILFCALGEGSSFLKSSDHKHQSIQTHSGMSHKTINLTLSVDCPQVLHSTLIYSLICTTILLTVARCLCCYAC